MGFALPGLPAHLEVTLPGSGIALYRVNSGNFDGIYELHRSNWPVLRRFTQADLDYTELRNAFLGPDAALHFGVWTADGWAGHAYLRAEQRPTVGGGRDLAGDKPELGIFIDQAHYGHGIATEVVKTLSQLAFTRLLAPRLTALVGRGNMASARVLQKAGFEYVDDVVIEGARNLGSHRVFSKESNASEGPAAQPAIEVVPLGSNKYTSVARILLNGMNQPSINHGSNTNYLVEAGSAMFVVGKRVRQVKKGDLVFVPRGTRYQDIGRDTVLTAVCQPPFDPKKVEVLN